MSLKNELTERIGSLSEEQFNYIETDDITRATEIGDSVSGLYMEATVIYLGIKNMSMVVKENGRRKTALAYNMIREVTSTLAKKDGGFLSCYSPESFLVIFPGKNAVNNVAVKCALKIAYALHNTFKPQLSQVVGLEFAFGVDHGHIMGTKNKSDEGCERLVWFGSTICKAKRISFECARPYHVGISSIVFHNIDSHLKSAQRRILGFKKTVEIWTKISYQFENEKKHLYQTNHKIDFDVQ